MSSGGAILRLDIHAITPSSRLISKVHSTLIRAEVLILATYLSISRGFRAAQMVLALDQRSRGGIWRTPGSRTYVLTGDPLSVL